MNATSISMTDDAVREIGEQVSQMLIGRLPKWGGTALDLTKGIDLYHNRIETFGNLQTVRNKKDGSKNRNDNKVKGNTFEVLDIGNRREEGRVAYRTDELAELDPDDPLFKKHPKLLDFAKTNDEQIDGVVVRPGGKIETFQHKREKSINNGISSFKKDAEAGHFVVPSDQFDEYREELDKKIKEGGPDREKYEHIKRNLVKSKIPFDSTNKPISHIIKTTALDASKRIRDNVVVGVASDLAVFSCGGAAWEIRDAYRNPGTMPLLERCKRLILTIWERLREVLKDRSLREIGSEVIVLVGAALPAALKKAAENIVSVLRRLWMQFVDGRIKSTGDLIAACLKALVTVTTIAVIAFPLQTKLEAYMSIIPGGGVLAEVIAAVVAGVMIVIGNRAIDGVVRALFAMFNPGTIARLRREEIQRMCEEAIPRLIENRERLQALVDNHFAEREAMLDATFEDMQSARKDHDFDDFLKSLIALNQTYGRMLPWESFEEFNEFMLDDSRTLKL